MRQEVDVVVIGGGALGASTAYHLSTYANQRVALLDKHAPVSQTSPRAAGLTSQVRSSDVMTHIAIMSLEAVQRFTAETGEPFVFHQSGSLKIARRAQDVQRLEDDVERSRRFGLGINLMAPAAARERMPFLNLDGIQGLTFTPADLYFEPAQLPSGYLRASARNNVRFLPNTAVTGIDVHAGAVQRVVTEQGEIATSVVVDTAGAWTRLIGDMSGVRIPVVPTRHQLLITEQLSGVADDQPIVRIIDANMYLRPDGGGLLLGGYETDPLQFDARQLPADFQIKDLELNFGVLQGLIDTVIPQFPILRDVGIREHRGGLPTMTPDGKPIVGPVPDLEGFFIASGCCVGGLSISPAIGRIVAEWIVRGQPPLDVSELAPDRFGPEYASDEQLNAAAQWQYANQYTVH